MEGWPANDPSAPISRERQIELMRTAEERVKASLEYWRSKPKVQLAPVGPRQGARQENSRRHPQRSPPMTITTQAVREMAEGLRSHVNARGGSPLENGFWQRAINASDMLLALVEERDRLAEANAKKADDIVTLGQLVGKAEARAEAAEADARRWRALRDFPGVCMTLSRNEDHTPNYMTAAEWIERGMNSEDFEGVEAAEIERMKETDTIWRFQVYPDTPVGFYVWYGATADYVLDAALQGIDRDAN